MSLKEGAWNVFGNTLKRSTQSDGPIVGFYDKQVNRYAANIFGVLGLKIKLAKDASIALTMGFQRSVIERNKFLTETKEISLGFKFQYLITR